jgi:hypothetical protein
MSPAGGVIWQWRRQRYSDDSRGMTRNDRPAAMRASDSDRDAVVSDLSEHFQAGRLTAAELDERTGRALTARTWGELTDLAVDLPALRPAALAAVPAAARPGVPARHTAPALAGLAIAAAVLVFAVHGGWGLIWLLFPLLVITRRVICH